jgi:hypothetical protein
LNPHIIGLAVCDKNGSLSLFINNPTLYSATSVLYLSKYSFADSKMNDLIALDK